MILWTIQTDAAWHDFRSRGVLRGARERIDADPVWVEAYRWMVQQMTRRIGPPPTPDSYPVWAWFQWANATRAKPDLRSAAHLSKGEKGVRIEFECPEGLALLSDFDLWHCALNYCYLPVSEQDGDRFDEELKQRGMSWRASKPFSNLDVHQIIERSWEKIFDLDWSEDGYSNPKSQKSIQATFWELRVDQVRHERHFTAR